MANAMVTASPSEHERADGLAVFAAAAFLLGIGLIAVLERVGAPDAFVQALGPLFALLALGVIGALTRAPSLIDFLAARRSAPPLYCGLAFAATAAGLIAAVSSGPGGAATPPWLGVATGLAGAALIVGPAIRAAKASALADVLATSFPANSTRLAFSILLGSIGFLTAIAGFDLATNTLMAAVGTGRGPARALVALALVLSIVPGGLKGLLWSDAASGGGALLIAAIGAGLAVMNGSAPFAPLAALVDQGLAEPVWSVDAPAIWRQAAAAVAVAGFFAFAAPAIGERSAGKARRAGILGLALGVVGVALVGVALPYFSALVGGPSRTAQGLICAATWLPALALARAGVLGATRAGGYNLVSAYSRLTVLSSRRIALNRAGMLAIIALSALAGEMRLLDTVRALDLALAIGLAFVTPSLLLAMISRTPSGAALAALGTGLAAAVARSARFEPMPSAPDLLISAAIVGAASLVVGAAFALLFPQAPRLGPRAIADPFVDLPLDGVE